MSELNQDVSRRVRRFSEEFKREALRLVVEEGYTFKAASAAVGVSESDVAGLAREVHSRHPSHAARTPRWRTSARRISDCVSSCDGPSWSERS